MTSLCGRLTAGQHSFIIGAGRVPEVDDAIAEIGSWLRKASASRLTRAQRNE